MGGFDVIAMEFGHAVDGAVEPFGGGVGLVVEFFVCCGVVEAEVG